MNLMKWFQKAKTKIQSIFTGFFYGMKAADSVVFNSGVAIDGGTTINQQVHSNRVSHALLKGELTQEVKELRYRTYKVDREAKDFEYYSSTLALRRDKQDSKFMKFENDDNLSVVTIQPNFINMTTVENGIKDVEYNVIRKDKEGEDVLDYGRLKTNRDYVVKLERPIGFTPRYYIEDYLKMLVVKKDSVGNAILDLYFTVYPNDKDFKSKGFVREIERIRDGGRSDVIDISKLWFTTVHAYKQVDMLEYEFDGLKYDKVLTFDGHYIVRFIGNIVKDGVDEMDKYYCKEMDDKYKNKEKRPLELNISGTSPVTKYVCEECGKEILYDENTINEVSIVAPREIDEETIETSNATEYMDIQITQQTFGRVLCKDCLEKYLNKQR